MCLGVPKKYKRNLLTALHKDTPRIVAAAGDVGERSFSAITLTEQDEFVFHSLAHVLYMRDGQQLIESLSNGNLILSLKDNEPRWELHDVQPLNKHQRYREKLKARQAATAATATQHSEGNDQATKTDVPNTNFSAPSGIADSGDSQQQRSATDGASTPTFEDSPTSLDSHPLRESGIKRGRPRVEDGQGSRSTLQRQRRAKVGDPPTGTRQRVTRQHTGVRQVAGQMRESILAAMTENAAKLSYKVTKGACPNSKVMQLGLFSGGRHGKLFRSLKDWIPARFLEQIRQEGAERFKKTMRDPQRITEAMSRAHMSFDQYDRFLKYLVPGEKGVKASRRTIVYARHAIGDLMQRINPIKKTAGGDGYGHNAVRFFQCLLPAYFNRCARAMFADGDEDVQILTPPDPSSPSSHPLNEEQQVCLYLLY